MSHERYTWSWNVGMRQRLVLWQRRHLSSLSVLHAHQRFSTRCPRIPLHLAFRTCSSMGTPDESMWRDVTTLPDFKTCFPKWPKRSIGKSCPSLDAAGADLLERMLAYEPSARITARQALRHPYFADLDMRSVPVDYAAHVSPMGGAGMGAM